MSAAAALGDLQRSGDAEQVDDGDVPFAPLDAAVIRPVQSAVMCEALLGPAASGAQGPESFAEDHEVRMASHGRRTLTGLQLMGDGRWVHGG